MAFKALLPMAAMVQLRRLSTIHTTYKYIVYELKDRVWPKSPAASTSFPNKNSPTKKAPQTLMGFHLSIDKLKRKKYKDICDEWVQQLWKNN